MGLTIRGIHGRSVLLRFFLPRCLVVSHGVQKSVMNRQIRYIAQRVIVGVVIALVLSFAHRTFADVFDDYGSYSYKYGSVRSGWYAADDLPEACAELGQLLDVPSKLHYEGDHVCVYRDGSYVENIYADHRNLCPNGDDPVDGSCVADPAENCPAEGVHVTRTISVNQSTADALAANPNLNSGPVRDPDGCTYAPGGLSACVADPTSPGHAMCSFGYVSNHAVTSDSSETLSSTFDDAPPPEDAPKSTTQDTTTTKENQEPTVQNMSDGSVVTTEQSSETTTGGAFSVVSDGGDGGATVTGAFPSTSVAQTTTETVTNADGSGRITTDKTIQFTNGDRYTLHVDPTGTTTITRTEQGHGGGTTTTVTHVNSNGQVVGETTTRIGDADATGSVCTGDADCGSHSGASDAADDSNGDGDSVEGEGDCDPSQGKCDQSGKGGTFSGSPFPALDDQPSVNESVVNLVDGIESAPLLLAVNGISAGVPSSGDCPMGSVHLDMFDADFDLSAGCDLYDQVRPILSTVAKAAWSFLAVVILLGI